MSKRRLTDEKRRKELIARLDDVRAVSAELERDVRSQLDELRRERVADRGPVDDEDDSAKV